MGNWLMFCHALQQCHISIKAPHTIDSLAVYSLQQCHISIKAPHTIDSLAVYLKHIQTNKKDAMKVLCNCPLVLQIISALAYTKGQ